MALGINRPRKPTRLKVIDGEHEAAAKRNPREPAGRFALPKAPSHLDKWERAAWAKFSKVMERMRIMTADDAAAFELRAPSIESGQKRRNSATYCGGVTYETHNAQGTRMVRAAGNDGAWRHRPTRAQPAGAFRPHARGPLARREPGGPGPHDRP